VTGAGVDDRRGAPFRRRRSAVIAARCLLAAGRRDDAPDASYL
jgi:hypothetical protein